MKLAHSIQLKNQLALSGACAVNCERLRKVARRISLLSPLEQNFALAFTMKLAHFIRARVFSYEKDNENETLILDSLKKLFPIDLAKEKISVEKSVAEGFNEKRIFIFEISLGKERHITQFLNFLNDTLSENEKTELLLRMDSHIDDELTLFIRFDKKEWMENKKLVLTDSGDCFHVRISLAAFPKKREPALVVAKKIFA